jgi:hypothetical protein
MVVVGFTHRQAGHHWLIVLTCGGCTCHSTLLGTMGSPRLGEGHGIRQGVVLGILEGAADALLKAPGAVGGVKYDGVFGGDGGAAGGGGVVCCGDFGGNDTPAWPIVVLLVSHSSVLCWPTKT